MKLRVIAGRYGGRNLIAPTDTATTHPMGERVRNALFNAIGDEIQGARVLDVFAGSGAIGLEALSRGARHVTFVEQDRQALAALRSNVEAISVQADVTIVGSSVEQWLARGDRETFDIIFADPPYADVQFSTVQKLFGLLKPGALMVLSHPGRGEAPTGAKGIVVVDNRSYGAAALTFFRRGAEWPFLFMRSDVGER